MVDFRINVIVDARNAATNITIIEKRFYGLQRRLLSIYSLLGRFGPSLAAALTFRALQQQLDGYTALQNRLKAVTREGENLAKVNEDLLQVANRSRSSLTEVGRIYSRLSVSSKQLGISQAELIDFTESLAKTIAISGATSYEAQGALTQFSQALAATALRGDELRSVLEQLPEVSNIIAKRFGVSSGELAKLGEKGLITSKQIIAAFRDAREEIEERFGKTVPTISQSFTVFGNQLLVTLGELDRTTKFSEILSRGIIFLAQNIDLLIQILENLAVAAGFSRAAGAISRLGLEAVAATAKYKALAIEGIKPVIINLLNLSKAFAQRAVFGLALSPLTALQGGLVGVATGLLKLTGLIAASPFKLLGAGAGLAAKSLLFLVNPLKLLPALLKGIGLAGKLAFGPLGFLIITIISLVPEFQGAFDAMLAAVVSFAEYVTGIDFSNFDLGEFLQNAAIKGAKAIDGVIAYFNGFLAFAKQLWEEFLTQPEIAFILVGKYALDLVESMIDVFQAFYRTIIGLFVGIGKDIGTVFSSIADIWVNLTSGNLTGAKEAADRAVAAITNIPKRVINVFDSFSDEYKKATSDRLLPDPKLPQEAEDMANRIGEAFRKGVEESAPSAQKAIEKLFGINPSVAQQLGIDAAQAFGTGVMLYRDQNQENIQAALFGPVRGPAMVEQNPLYVPSKKGFGPRPDQPAGADVARPAQGLAGNLAAAGAAPEDPYAKSLESLKAIVAVEATRLTQGDLIAAQLEARYEIEKENVTLTQQQVAELEKFVKLSRDAAALANLADQIDRKKQFVEQERLLNELLRVRPDLLNEIKDKLVQDRIAALEASKALGDGFERAFLKLGEAARDYASAAEGFVNGFADRATDAITEFVLTGKGSFKEFASAILADIVRIIVRLLVLQAIQAAVGVATGGTSLAVGAAAGAGAAAAGGGGQKAAGGTVQPDRSYLVGEKGPEIFQPNKTGTIIPNGQPAAPPQVNVQVVNVEDPKKIPQTINGGGADEAILNVLSRRRDAVKRTLG